MAAKVAGLYDMEDTLGSGHFAVVKSARHVFTGELPNSSSAFGIERRALPLSPEVNENV